ncbi:MAG: DUF4390 domain-containing protein [Burkholderiales bacterium]|nr:DUF4390 domain-containing protein [Burkholderiales bacterium]
MTVSITRCFRRLSAAAVAVLALLPASLPAAEAIEFRDARIEQQDETLIVSADFGIELSARVEEALGKGVPLFFNFEFELIRPRWYWFDEKPVELVQTYRLSYHALTRQYRLSAGTLYQSFSSLAEALRLLSRPRLPPIERARVRAGESYVAAVRLRLDTNQLPKPFQLSAMTSRDWTLDSDWRRFPYRVEAPAAGAGERK